MLDEAIANSITFGKPRSKRRHSHRTRMSSSLGRLRDADRGRTPPGSPGKINFRRSDPRHPTHPLHGKAAE